MRIDGEERRGLSLPWYVRGWVVVLGLVLSTPQLHAFIITNTLDTLKTVACLTYLAF
jgi:hypothetical protein